MKLALCLLWCSLNGGVHFSRSFISVVDGFAGGDVSLLLFTIARSLFIQENRQTECAWDFGPKSTLYGIGLQSNILLSALGRFSARFSADGGVKSVMHFHVTVWEGIRSTQLHATR